MNTKKWRSFTEARIFAQNLKLSSKITWHQWLKKNEKPIDIPSSPQNAYRNNGWISWGDWLGTASISSKHRIYRPFSEARLFVRQFHFKNSFEFQKWSQTKQKPNDIPSDPPATYKENGWVNWDDFLGTNNRRNIQFRPFEQARQFARKLQLKSSKDWYDWAKNNERPFDIPAEPNKTYRNKGWVNWGDWLGKPINKAGPPLKNWWPFAEARQFARSLNLKNSSKWKDWVRTNPQKIFKNIPNISPILEHKEEPLYLPICPDLAYKEKGWVNWGDWLGTERVVTKIEDYRNFYQARTFAQQLGLTTGNEWKAWAKTEKRPKDIPKHPYYYRDKWKGWGNWLGTGKLSPYVPKREYRPFKEARAYIQTLGLKSTKKWEEWLKTGACPKDIPHSPWVIYRKKGWINFYDWLGTEPICFLSYKKARAYVHTLYLKSEDEWRLWSRSEACPKNIPHNPRTFYKDKGWKGINDWLGYEKR